MKEAIMKKLEAAQSRYESEIDKISASLVDKVEFDFSIFYQPGDGFVMVYQAEEEFMACNAGIGDCLVIIEKKGSLSLKDYMDLRI